MSECKVTNCDPLESVISHITSKPLAELADEINATDIGECAVINCDNRSDPQDPKGYCPRCREEVDALRKMKEKPPCLECGAMTEYEAQTKCICGGDKDHCHGCDIWEDD
jgi:hypothetical protein